MKNSQEPLLDVRDLSLSFGGLDVLREVSFTVRTGEILGVIGPNGAGKTTLFNVLSGVYRPSRGQVNLAGQELIGLRPNQICRHGIARTFQIVRPFATATVLQNVQIGAIFGRSGPRLNSTELAEVVQHTLEFVDLWSKRDQPASSLNWAELKRLEVARALAAKPKVLLLDETFSGLTPTETAWSMRLIRRIRDEAEVTVLWIEHVMKALMSVAERVIVLDYGLKIADGSVEEVINDPAVIEAYLGPQETAS